MNKLQLNYNFLAQIYFFLLIILSLIPSAYVEINQLRQITIITFLGLVFLVFFFSFNMNLKTENSQNSIAIILILLIFISFILSLNQNFYLKGYKFLTIIPIIIFTKHVVQKIKFDRFLNIFFTVLSSYIIISAIYALSFDVSKVFSPYAQFAYTRYEFTDSITNHSINCLVYLFLSYSSYKKTTSLFKKNFLIITSLAAIVMIFLSASRQVIAVIILFYFISVLIKRDKKIIDFIKVIFIFTILFTIFYLFSYFIENSFYIRIFENEENFSSGRFDSIKFWHDMVKNEGTLGFGYIINNTSLFIVESPHNEFARFYFEGGIPGALFLIILFFYLIKCLSQIVNSHIDKELKFISVLFFSVILGQSFLNNIFNDIYRLFIYMFLLVSIYEISLIKYNNRDNV